MAAHAANTVTHRAGEVFNFICRKPPRGMLFDRQLLQLILHGGLGEAHVALQRTEVKQQRTMGDQLGLLHLAFHQVGGVLDFRGNRDMLLKNSIKLISCIWLLGIESRACVERSHRKSYVRAKIATESQAICCETRSHVLLGIKYMRISYSTCEFPTVHMCTVGNSHVL